MDILTFPLGQLQANCYFLIEDKNCIIIDSGDDAAFILEEIQRRNLFLRAIIATHGHFDHIMAVGEIQLSFPVPFYIFKQDHFLVDRVGETAKHFLGYESHIIKPKKTRYLQQKNIQLSIFNFQILHTPGHTPGSACFYFRKEQTVFTGDTLFKESVGRFDHSYSSRTQLKKSLEKIFKLPDETIIYSGHGEVTSLAAEKKMRTMELVNF